MIHITTASQKTKAELIALVYSREEWGYIIDLPINIRDQYHLPTHILDTRTMKIINLIDRGIEQKKIYKTNTI